VYVCVCAVWRQEQLEYINSVCEGAERKAALCGLMEQEAELIASIGRHKIQADAKNTETGIMQFLNKVRAHPPFCHTHFLYISDPTYLLNTDSPQLFFLIAQSLSSGHVSVHLVCPSSLKSSYL